MAIDLKNLMYFCVKKSVIFPLNMHYFTCEFFTELIWNVQALDLLQSEKLFYFFFLFLILKTLQKSELPPWFEKGGGRGGGRAGPACLYVSLRAFFTCKSCTFLGSSDFLFCFLFPWSILQWASFIYSRQLGKIQNYVTFI